MIYCAHNGHRAALSQFVSGSLHAQLRTTCRNVRPFTLATLSQTIHHEPLSKRRRARTNGTVKLCARGHRFAATLTRSQINPPESTLPPNLTLPHRGDKSLVWYLWKLAGAYGSFYKTGVKAILANRKEANQVIERLQKETKLENYLTAFDVGYSQLLTEAVKRKAVSRAEYQLIHRHAHDIRRVPIFAVLVLLLGEWLPLIVPFAPSLPPLTCQIPSQTTAIRQKVEERRRMSFRLGTKAPSVAGTTSQSSATTHQWQLSDRALNRSLLGSFNNETVYHLSCVLNLHGRLWETLNLGPPTNMMRSRLASRLQYLAQDDILLLRSGGVKSLSAEETKIACEERGVNVVGPPDAELKTVLSRWLQAQQQDHGHGGAVLDMLFKRPNAWTAIK